MTLERVVFEISRKLLHGQNSLKHVYVVLFELGTFQHILFELNVSNSMIFPSSESSLYV